MKNKVLILLSMTLLASTATADDQQDNKRHGGHRGPPKAAVEACATLTQGDYCTFSGREDELVEGNCEAPEDKPLACKPVGDPPKRDRLVD